MLIMAYNANDSADIGSKGILNVSSPSTSGMGSSSRTLSGSESVKQPPVLHGYHLSSFVPDLLLYIVVETVVMVALQVFLILPKFITSSGVFLILKREATWKSSRKWSL